MHIVNPLLVLRTFRAYCHLVFHSAFERKTLRMMAGDEVTGRYFSKLRLFGFTRFKAKIGIVTISLSCRKVAEGNHHVIL